MKLQPKIVRHLQNLPNMYAVWLCAKESFSSVRVNNLGKNVHEINPYCHQVQSKVIQQYLLKAKVHFIEKY